MSYYEPEEEFYSGFDPNDPAMLQAMLDQYLMGTGETFGPGGPYGDINVPAMDPGQYQALAGLLPNTQPSGKPMTVSNITGALSANRSALFDPALMGFGGMDAFAPNAFESTVTSTIKQTPELQQMYGYLRSPDSVEGLIANEVMNGGTPSTAVRKLRELLASPDTDPEFKASLLMELPQRPVEYGMPAPELAVENVNWDADEGSVFEQARGIGDLYAQIPRVGPSGPQWDPNTGQQISAGGELQWSVDETGAPVMIEVTETASPLAEKYHALGLPTPDEEYTQQDFMTPDQIAMQQALGEMEDPIAQLKAAWMDPSLAPTNRETMTPYKEGYAPGGGGGGGGDQGQPEALWEESLLDVMGQNPSGDTSGIVNSITRQGLWDIITGNEGEGQPGGGPREEDALRAAATTGTLGGNYLADAILQNPSGDTGGVWNSFTGQGLWDILTGNEGPGGGQSSGPDYPAGSPATYEEFLASGGQPSQPGFGDNNLAGAFQALIQAGQPTATPQVTNAMLAQIIGGGRQEPGYQQGAGQQARQPGDTSQPGYQQGAAEQARQPGGPGFQQEPGYQQGAGSQARQPGGTSYLQAVETGEGRAAQRQQDEQQAQILGGSTDRTGKRVRPTRTGEQARQYRAAFDAWDQATDEQRRLQGQAHTFETGQAKGRAWKLQQQGVRPLDQALMARRLVLMGAGMPQGRAPGL